MKNKRQNINYVQAVMAIAGVLLFALLTISAAEHRNLSKVSKVRIHIMQPDRDIPFIDDQFIRDRLIEYFSDDLSIRELIDVDPMLVEEVLEENVYIKSVEANLDNKNQLNIKVVERVPVLRVITAQTDVYLDAEGVSLPIQRGFYRRVPVVTGHKSFKKAVDFNLETLQELAQILQADQFLDAFIEQIYFDQRGDILCIPKIGKQQIRIGKAEELNNKFYKLRQFYKKGLPQVGWDKYTEFDFDYRGQVVCKKALKL